MNRSELVAALADRAEVTRKDADAVLAAFADVVGDIVSKGGTRRSPSPASSPSSAPTVPLAPLATRRPASRSRSRPATA
ncbi:hypothetical protein GCM10020256_47870 [Streptomyces thermocoprophilus]